MSTERDRLLNLIKAARYPSREGLADYLLAAGVTLPPEPPALVTEEMLAAPWDALKRRLDSVTRWNYIDPRRKEIELAHANALVESAIRRAVERKTDSELADLVDAVRQCGYESKRIRSVVVGFFTKVPS